MSTILLIEDESAIADTVVYALESEGLRCVWKNLGREGVAYLHDHGDVSLVILDVGLPDGNGFEFCKEIRRDSNVPIIFLTARNHEIDRIVGLEIGADDYVAKPFNPRELLARINSVLRRTRNQQGAGHEGGGHLLRFEGWSLDTRRRELNDPNGVVVDLSTGEYDLLLTFLELPQRVLTRDQLMDSAKHRMATGFDRAIDIQVSRLRKKLGSDEDGQNMIKTIRGSGYMFVPAVTRA